MFHQVPGFIVHHHFHQHIAREELAFGGALLTVLHFHDFFGRHQDAAKLALHAFAVDTFDDVALGSLFHAGIGVHHVPAHPFSGHTIGHGALMIGHYFLQPRIRS
ncbi:hypothetical protein D9M68_981570 [compost metagenome]